MNFHTNDEYLYLQIAAALRRDIENGILKPGDALPPIRNLTETWHCTIGTVQRAIQELAAEGLVATHIGKRTRVTAPFPLEHKDSLRRANLIHRAETFLLEVMTSGYEASEAEDAFRIALSRWQSVSLGQQRVGLKTLRFSGSHDLAFAWIATHFAEITSGTQLHLEFCGSLPGLQDLAEGRADLAGAHLLDSQTGDYNIAAIQTLLPGESMALITLAQRRLGFIVRPGNPMKIQNIKDLARPGLRFINRNAGSGTRVYLDLKLQEHGIEPENIKGYETAKRTHSEIAAEVAEGLADVGIGLEAAARAYGLEFVFLTLERYDLVMRHKTFSQPAIQDLLQWLQGEDYFQLLKRLGGYDASQSGQVRWTAVLADEH